MTSAFHRCFDALFRDISSVFLQNGIWQILSSIPLVTEKKLTTKLISRPSLWLYICDDPVYVATAISKFGSRISTLRVRVGLWETWNMFVMQWLFEICWKVTNTQAPTEFNRNQQWCEHWKTKCSYTWYMSCSSSTDWTLNSFIDNMLQNKKLFWQDLNLRTRMPFIKLVLIF